MTAPSVPPPPAAPPPPPRGAGSPVLVWLIALGMVVVVAAAVVTVVWLTRGDGGTEAGASTTPAVSSSTEPTTISSSAPSSTSTVAPTTSTSGGTTSTSAGVSSTSTSTTSSTTTTTRPPGPCWGEGAGPLPAGPIRLVEATGDFDGDGVGGDRFLLYPGSAGTWVARMELTYGYSSAVDYPSHAVTAEARAVDLGGTAQLAIVVSVGESGNPYVDFFAWRRSGLHTCELVRAEDPAAVGGFRGFPLVDAEREKVGITCQDAGIKLTLATSTDGITWRATSRVLYWDTLAETFYSDPGVGFVLTLHSPEDDALIQSYADFDC